SSPDERCIARPSTYEIRWEGPGGTGASLRDFVAGTADPELLHAAAERVRVKLQELGRAPRSLDHAASLLERGQNMIPLDLLEQCVEPRLRIGRGRRR